jgi:serine O-acetyltransferase
MTKNMIDSIATSVARGVSWLDERCSQAVGSMREDIQAAKDRDPASPSTFTIVLSYSGLHAIWNHRREHWLWKHDMKGLARWLSQMSRFFTGIEIHPAAQIGRRFFIDHGSGVVIGETAIIGDDVMLYQGVTLGGTGKETGKRHPTLEDGVIVGVGASVLGSVTIGKNTKIGGGAVVVDDVPPDCTVVGIPGHVVRHRGKRIDEEESAELLRHEPMPDPMKEAIQDLRHRVSVLEQRCGAAEMMESIVAEQSDRLASDEDAKSSAASDDMAPAGDEGEDAGSQS